MIRRTAVLAAALLAPALALTSAAQAGDPGTPHYPDLQTLKPTGVRVVQEGSGQRLLRFSNIIANRGAGPLELHGVVNTTTGQTDAFQAVHTHNAAGAWSEVSRTPAGSFEYHPTHNHWHFAGFARYELRRALWNGGIGAQVYALSDKVSFCVLDFARSDSALEHAGAQTYFNCNRTSVQGLSVGWADIYAWYLDGQSLDITGLANGIYYLVSTVDPGNVLSETNDGNNAAYLKIWLSGGTARVVP